MRVDQARTAVDAMEVILEIESDVRYWCELFNPDTKELPAAVSAVGAGAVDMEQRLQEAARKAFHKTGED